MSQAEVLDRIVSYAESWQGVKEIPGNMGWENEEFQNLLEQAGWEKGQAWCLFFVKAIYYKVFGPIDFGTLIEENFTGSATQTFANCKENPRFQTTTKNEVAGAVAIFRLFKDGEPDWRGHGGIVIEPGAGDYGSHFKTVDGNTSPEDVRTGGMVAFNTWRNNYQEEVTDGLKLEGFILPPVPLEKLESKNINL